MTRWATGWATRLVPIFATMLMLVGARAYVASREAARPLPVLGNLPSFRLTDQEGRAYGSDDLDGKVWVASFIFTRCATVCPLLVERVRDVERFLASHPALDARTRLVSVSVDPKGDTPERLGAFARERHIDGARWRLLTGPAESLEDVVVGGFKLAVGEPVADVAAGKFEILHSSRLVLVDGRRRIRGYYEGEAAGVERLERDLLRLVAQEPAATAPAPVAARGGE